MKNQRNWVRRGQRGKGAELLGKGLLGAGGVGLGRGSHGEFAVTQLLVDLPAEFGHVLLGEAEWLRQGQVLAVLGVRK